ncbi:MAG: hypothetical protein AAB795_01405 [Patescibacteria group bacterium]
MFDQANDSSLDKFVEETRKQVEIGRSALELLESCLRGDHRNKKILEEEREQFIGRVVYELEWCAICGSLRYAYKREADENKFNFTVCRKESEFLKSIRAMLNKPSGAK